MQKDILFDNIYVGHSIADAEALKAATYDIKSPVEEAERAATKPKEPERPKSPLDLKFMDDPVKFVREKFDLFVAIARRDPLEAVRVVPEAAGGIGAVVATVLILLVSVFTMGGGGARVPDAAKKAAEKAKDVAADAKEGAAKAASSGVEKAQEISKRATRSSTAAQQHE